MADRDRKPDNSRIGGDAAQKALIGVTALVAAGAAIAIRRKLIADRGDPNRTLFGDAPLSTARGNRSGGWNEGTLFSRSVTINRPRQELYDFWRDFRKLSLFLENVRSVTPIDDLRSRWVIDAPAGRTVEFTSRITEDLPGRVIAWSAEEGGDIANSGRIEFSDAAPGRGSVVRAVIAYDPPAGAIGRIVATLFQKEPKLQARRDLRRFKQLMETGEIATTEPGPAAPRA